MSGWCRRRAESTAGRVRLEGLDLLALDERELQRVRGARIGFVFQEPMAALNPSFTVGDQVAEVLQVHGIATGAAARARAVELLDAVRIPEPAHRARDFPHQLSGGMRQRVLIAAAVACRPALVIADEPTTALDATVQAEILDLLTSMRREFGLSLLLITHDPAIVARVADRVAVMYAGRIVETGPARGVLASPAPSVHAGPARVAARTGPGSAPRGDSGRGARPRRSPSGVRVRAALPRAVLRLRRVAPCRGHRVAGPRGPVLPPRRSGVMAFIDVSGLVKTFERRQALWGRRSRIRAVDGVSFTIDEGETFGLVGESGCGKTTTARCLLRLVEPTAGSFTFRGEEVFGLPAARLRRLRRDMQMTFRIPDRR